MLTLNQLEEMGACEGAIDLFKEVFGERADLGAVVKELHERNLVGYEGWLLAQKYELTKELLKEGANVHADNDYAICLASKDGRLDVVKLLLDRGANVYASNNYALRWASANGHFDVVKLLKKAMKNS